MSKNPFVNAGVAAIYIFLVASFMYYGPKFTGPVDSVIVPVAILSLFVLSAAVMGFVFCYQPIKLYLEGEKRESLILFLKTVGIFACITFLFIFTIFFITTINMVPNIDL